MSQSFSDHEINQVTASQSNDLALALSSAHSPLEVPELLEMILSNLTRREIVLAARVCRTWSEPALDRIWRKMYSLVPLFTLIRPMGRQLSRESAADFSRYAIYAPRIREVIITDYDREGWISAQTMWAAVGQLPSHLQLPLPTSIHSSVTAPAPATLLEIPLIFQSLRRLTLSELRSPTSHGSPSFASYLQRVMQTASRLPHPSLEEFEVCCFTSSAAFIGAFNVCLIKHGARIAKLTARFPFDGQVWASIFSLPTLQTLDVAPLNYKVLGMSDEIIPMIRTLVERQPLLKSLQLDLGLAPHGDPSDSAYSWIIRALMGLRSLETLKLHISLPLYLSESEVREMGASWPRMRILEFWTISYRMAIPRQGAAPQCDLSLLPCFLRELPRLEELHVSFKCNAPLKAPEQPPASTLQALNLGKCPVPEASREEVVAYLAAILPRNTHVYHQSFFGPSWQFWDKVAYDLNSMRKAAQ